MPSHILISLNGVTKAFRTRRDPDKLPREVIEFSSLICDTSVSTRKDRWGLFNPRLPENTVEEVLAFIEELRNPLGALPNLARAINARN